MNWIQSLYEQTQNNTYQNVVLLMLMLMLMKFNTFGKLLFLSKCKTCGMPLCPDGLLCMYLAGQTNSTRLVISHLMFKKVFKEDKSWLHLTF